MQQRKEKDQTHHTNNNNKVPFQTTTKKQEQKRVRLVTQRTSRCRIYSTTHHTTEGAVVTERKRERESTLTVCHSCHRPRIPGGHVLIERSCPIKHCKKREGCNKEKRKTKPTTQTTTTKSRFKPQPKTRTTRVRLVTRRTSSCAYIQQHTTTKGAVATEREREYTYCIP